MTSRPEPWLGRIAAWSLLLYPASLLYALGWACLRLFRKGRPAKAGVPVLSVGNLSVGGTGKSLLVRALLKRAARKGRRPAVLLRGYGARSGPRPLRVRIRGRDTGEEASQACGDEAVEHALSGLGAVWVDADRLRAAKAAVAEGADCLVLDDGFQRRWQLGRDLDLLLVDYRDLQSKERLLPAGPFREPWSQAALADLILVSGAPKGLQGAALRAALPRAWRARNLFRLDRVATGLRSWPQGAALPLARLHAKRVLALSGLGRPQAFEDTLRALGALPQAWRFRDHHRFSLAELRRPPAQASMIITTAKDAVRLPAVWRPELPVCVLQVESRVSPAAPFWRRVDAALGRRAPISHP